MTTMTAPTTPTQLEGWSAIDAALKAHGITGANHSPTEPDDFGLPRDPHGLRQEVGIERDGTLFVGVLVTDEQPHIYWDGDGLGTLWIGSYGRVDDVSDTSRQPRSMDPDDVPAYLASLDADGTLWFPVDIYDHTQVHYSVANTSDYPDRQWDVACAGIFLPCDEEQDEYRKRVAAGDPTARQQAIDNANAILDEYSKWVNGEVYGIATVEIDLETGEASGQFFAWGYVGQDYAESELHDEVVRLARVI